ncbi:MAG: NHLP leader peptide family RiPP precursor [Pseudomonadota bacterium]|nr:NHLP leader peptide family RiPP precursor [Pseudomonadota bacterium]
MRPRRLLRIPRKLLSSVKSKNFSLVLVTHAVSVNRKGNHMSHELQDKKISEIIAKCWVNPGFKQKLLSDTHATLQAEGVQIPAGVTVNVLENSATVLNYVLPSHPAGQSSDELSDSDLMNVAGGFPIWGFRMEPKKPR